MAPFKFSAENVSAQIAEATITIDSDFASRVKQDPFLKELIDLIASRPKDASHFAVYIGEKILWELLVPEEMFPDSAPIPSVPYRALALSYIQKSFNSRQSAREISPNGPFMAVERKLAGFFDMKYLISIKPKELAHIEEVRNEVLRPGPNLTVASALAKTEEAITEAEYRAEKANLFEITVTADQGGQEDGAALKTGREYGINVHAPSFEMKKPDNKTPAIKAELSVEVKQPFEGDHSKETKKTFEVKQDVEVKHPAQTQAQDQAQKTITPPSQVQGVMPEKDTQVTPAELQVRNYARKTVADAAADAFSAFLMGKSTKPAVLTKPVASATVQGAPKATPATVLPQAKSDSGESHIIYKGLLNAVIAEATPVKVQNTGTKEVDIAKKATTKIVTDLAEPKTEEALSITEKPTSVLASPIAFSAAMPAATSVLPDGWRSQVTSDGRTYYIDDNTQTTSWSPPAISVTQNIRVPIVNHATTVKKVTTDENLKTPSSAGISGSERNNRVTKLDVEGVAATKRLITRGLGVYNGQNAPASPAPAPAATGDGAWGTWTFGKPETGDWAAW